MYFSENPYSFSLVHAGNDRDALLALADRLGLYLGSPQNDREAIDPALLLDDGGRARGESLDPEDELLLGAFKRCLAQIAARAASGACVDLPNPAVSTALHRADLVMRGQLAMGNRRRLPELLPSLVYLVMLPIDAEDQALELSQRAAAMIDESWESGTEDPFD